MARACVEDSCSVVAGNGISNPDALLLTVPLDPIGGITCNGVVQPGTPGVGLGVTIPIEPDNVSVCDNILHRNPGTGEFYVGQPGGTSVGIPDVTTVLGFSASPIADVPVTGGTSIVNPFPNCEAFAMAYLTVQLNYTVAGAGAAYFLRPISAIVASGVGTSSAGFGNPYAIAGATTSVIQRHDDYGTTAGAGANADIQQQYEMFLPVIMAAGSTLTIRAYHNQFEIGNTASANIRHSPSANPFVEVAGTISVFKRGVVT